MKKNVLINIAEYTISIVIMLLSSRLIISGLGVESYSIYSGASMIIALSMLIDSGVSIITTRDAINNRESNKQQNAYLSSSLTVYLSISLIFVMLFILLVDDIFKFLSSDGYNNDSIYNMICILPVIIVINIITGCFYAKIVADDAWFTIGIANVVGKIISLVFVVVAFVSDSFEPLMIIMSGLLIGAIVRLSMFIYFCIVSGFRLEKFIFPHCLSILSRMKYSFIATISTAIIYYLDKIVFSQEFGLLELSYLNFAFLIVNYIHGFYGNIYKVYFSRLVTKNNFFGTREFNFVVVSFLTFSTMVSLIVYEAWLPFVTIIIDEDFALNTHYYAKFLLILSTLRIFEIILHYSLHAINQVRTLMSITLVCAVFGALCYNYFLLYLSNEGTIIAQILMMLFYLLVLLYFSIFRGDAKCTRTS